MNKFLVGLFITVIAFTFPKITKAELVSNLILCSEDKINDNRFTPYINNGKLKEEPTCSNNYLNIYDWRQCVNATGTIIGVKIDEKVSTKELSDVFFDTVFDHCKTPLLFRSISPVSDDVYFTALLSSATFFYIRGTRYINIGDINTSSEFRKKLLLAYLKFLSDDAKIKYPLLHRGNGDPWIKFQKDGKYENPPDVVGIIGSDFAMFTNLSNQIKSFSFDELSSFANFFFYSNKKSSPENFTLNTLVLDKGEVVFITKNAISSPPDTVTSIISIAPTPTLILISPSTIIPPFFDIPIQPPTQSETLFNPTKIFSNDIDYQSFHELSNKFNLFFYLIFAVTYITVLHLAVGIKKEFNLFLMIGEFILGGIVGWQMQSWEIGIVVGVVLSLLFY